MNLPDFLFFCFPVRATSKTEEFAQSAVYQWLRSLWGRCRWMLIVSQEPQIWQERNRQGNVVAWHVYDPLSGHRSCFGTELEVRLWLEQQYNV